MIVNIAEATKTYLEANMTSIVGHGNAVLPVYTHVYPQGCAKCCILVRLTPGGRPDPYLLDVEHPVISIWVRHETGDQALTLMANVDLLFHRVVNKILTSSVYMYSALREGGPDRLDSENNGLVRYFCVYQLKVERRVT